MNASPIGEPFTYRVPSDLRVTETPINKVLVIGSCLVSGYADYIPVAHPGATADYVINNNGSSLPSEPPSPIASYDFQLVQMALRSILPDISLFRMPYDVASCQTLFNETVGRLRFCLAQEMKWNREHGILTFVLGFARPQANPMGRLLPRDDIRNIVYFVEQINVELRKEVAKYTNAFVVEVDDVLSTLGKRFFVDEVLWPTNHGAALGDNDVDSDQNRLVKPTAPSQLFELRIYEALQAIWLEVAAMFRTVRQVDSVKMVVVDLDDTLWRGIAAEQQDAVPHVEGWPLGIAEALLWLKKRGVILAIASKNDEPTIERLWQNFYWGALTLDDFALRRINWEPKLQNIEQIMKTAGLLPRNVVFIDDNPVEREAVKAAFPEIRVLGAELYAIRRALLWSPETQVPVITEESAQRSEMMRAQVQREGARAAMSQEDFIKSLCVEVELHVIREQSDQRFARAFELINKTNQYNTTGERWTPEKMTAALHNGAKLYAATVKDRFTGYGLVVVAIVQGNTVVQYVMSCRVLGLKVESMVLSEIAAHLAQQGQANLRGVFKKTSVNHLSAALYPSNGFERCSDDIWTKDISDLGAKAAE